MPPEKEKAAPTGECGTRPVVKANQGQNTPPAPSPQERFRCADCLHFRPFALRTAPDLGECRGVPPEIAFFFDREAAFTVRYVAEDDLACHAFHSRRVYAAACRGRAA